MATKFKDLPETKKGEIGERIMDDYLISKKIIPYKPTQEGAHPFDRLCATADKKTIFIAEAKAKPARKYYPDTGIDYKIYREYMQIQAKHDIRICLFFIDEDRARFTGDS